MMSSMVTPRAMVRPGSSMFEEFFKASFLIFVILFFIFKFFNFQEVMIMLYFLLTFLTKAEIGAFSAFISNSNNRAHEATFALGSFMD